MTTPPVERDVKSLERKRRKPTASTLQLFGLLIAAATGIIASSTYFHSGQLPHTRDDFILNQIINKPVTKPHLAPKKKKIEVKKRNATLSECLALNSKGWIEGPRIGNTQDGHISEDLAMEMILNGVEELIGPDRSGSIHDILKLTICHEQSRFLNFTDDGSDGQKSLQFWALRLIYLSFHTHQHKEAIAEAKLRQELGCGEILNKKGIGTFDFECPDAKFLVVPMKEMGLGAVMRLGAVNALFAAIGTNRTLLLVNNSPVGDRNIKKKWVHASCDRHDLQCFFMPPTPCTVTEAELQEAYAMSKSDNRRLFKFGEIPPDHVDDRVIVSDFTLRPKHVPPSLVSIILNYSESIIQQTMETSGKDDPRIEIMNISKNVIGEEKPFDRVKRYYYFGVESILHHAAVFYIMRPNALYSEKIEDILSKNIPKDFIPELSFGLPIRASDKCIEESECLSFPQYMKVMSQTWHKHNSTIKDITSAQGMSHAHATSIVLTTESQSVLREKKLFESNLTLKSQIPFDYNFVMNEHDVMQETGHPRDFMVLTADDVTADQVMLSAVSSLKAQLMAKFTVGNCCSNFHLLLFHFLQSGCGAARDNVGQCLQENEDAEFRLCCMWSKSDECQAKAEAKRNSTIVNDTLVTG